LKKEIEVQHLQVDIEKMKDKIDDEKDKKLLLEGSTFLNIGEGETAKETQNLLTKELKKIEDITLEKDKIRIQKEKNRNEYEKERGINLEHLSRIQKYKYDIKNMNEELDSKMKLIFQTEDSTKDYEGKMSIVMSKILDLEKEVSRKEANLNRINSQYDLYGQTLKTETEKNIQSRTIQNRTRFRNIKT